MSSVAQGPAGSAVSVTAEYKASPPSLSDQQTTPLLCDINGNLSVDVKTAIPAGTSIIGKVGIDQTTPGTTNGVQVNAALPAGTNLMGKVGIDQTTPGTTNGVQVNAALPAGTNVLGVVGNSQGSTTSGQSGPLCQAAVTTSAPTYSNGLTSPLTMGIGGLLRVDASGATIPTTTSYVSVKNEMDTALGDASVTTINGSGGAFVQVVSSLGNACKKIFIADTTGQFIGVYTGAAGFEALAFIINPGINQYREHAIAAGTRVSVRSMNTASITTGQYIMEFSA
jgi:hypothetical protein